MRNRTPDSTTPLDPADSWVYLLTEKGLRASGAASMKAAAANLRQTAAELDKAAERVMQEVSAPANDAGDTPPQGFRRGTICGRYRQESRVPHLRLGGKWLARAGFDLGQRYQVKVDAGQLTIRAEATTGASEDRRARP